MTLIPPHSTLASLAQTDRRADVIFFVYDGKSWNLSINQSIYLYIDH